MEEEKEEEIKEYTDLSTSQLGDPCPRSSGRRARCQARHWDPHTEPGKGGPMLGLPLHAFHCPAPASSLVGLPL